MIPPAKNNAVDEWETNNFIDSRFAAKKFEKCNLLFFGIFKKHGGIKVFHNFHRVFHNQKVKLQGYIIKVKHFLL